MRSHEVEIPAETRSQVGKTAARRLRSQGKIPAVLYGRNRAPLPLAVDARAFSHALHETQWYSSLIRLRIEGLLEGDPNPMAMIAEVQRDPARRALLSLDFHQVSLAESVQVHVPVIHVNQSPGVRKGGILEHLMHEVVVESLPTNIPDHLEADIGGLEIGDVLRVADLQAPPGVTVVSDPDEVVVVVAPPVVVREEAPAAEEGAVVPEAEEPEVIRQRKEEEE